MHVASSLSAVGSFMFFNVPFSKVAGNSVELQFTITAIMTLVLKKNRWIIVYVKMSKLVWFQAACTGL